MKVGITLAKIAAVLAMVVLLCSSYTLKSRVINLIKYDLEAREVRDSERRARFEETRGQRDAEYQLYLQKYEKDFAKYQEGLQKLAAKAQVDSEKPLSPEEQYRQTQRDYQQREYQQPLPVRPEKPMSLATADRLAQLDSDFRAARMAYFAAAGAMNWIIGVAAMVFVASMLTLILFDVAGPRIVYFVVLLMSFVFVIGPALYTTLTAVAYRLDPPGYQSYSPQRY